MSCDEWDGMMAKNMMMWRGTIVLYANRYNSDVLATDVQSQGNTQGSGANDSRSTRSYY